MLTATRRSVLQCSVTRSEFLRFDCLRSDSLMVRDSGSFLHSWILKAYPEMVTRSCFVDPVVFCSWEGGKSSLTVPYFSF